MNRLGSILAPDGMVVARVPNMGPPWDGIHQFGDVTHKAAYAANGLARLGLAAGLEVEAFIGQKRGSPVRRILEDILYWTLTRILVTQPVVWSPNIIVIWRKTDWPAW